MHYKQYNDTMKFDVLQIFLRRPHITYISICMMLRVLTRFYWIQFVVTDEAIPSFISISRINLTVFQRFIKYGQGWFPRICLSIQNNAVTTHTMYQITKTKYCLLIRDNVVLVRSFGLTLLQSKYDLWKPFLFYCYIMAIM